MRGNTSNTMNAMHDLHDLHARSAERGCASNDISRGSIHALARRALRALGWLSVAGAAAAAACGDPSPADPSAVAPGHSRFAVAPSFHAAPSGGPVIPLSRIRGVLIGAGGDSTVTMANFVGDSAVLAFDVQFSGGSAAFTLELTAFDDHNVIVYRSTQTLTLSPGDNRSIPAPVLVYAAPDSGVAKVAISPATVVLAAGAASTLNATGTGASGQAIAPVRVGWTSRDPAIATVGTNGELRAGAFQGSTYVVARTALDVADSVLVTVHAPVDTVVVAPATLQVIRGLTGAVGAELRDAGGHLIDDRAASWTTSDASVATVSNVGVVTGVKLGTATITATAEGKTATAVVTVVSPIDHIALTPASLTFASLKESQTLAALVVAKSGATVTGITPRFASSDAKVVSVDAAGKVTAVGNGTASITASAEGIQSAANVTVKQVATSIAISPKAAGITSLTEKRTFTALASDALGSSLTPDQVTFTSADPTIATISADGVVTGHKSGSTTITATTGTKSDTAVFTVAQIPTLLSVSTDHAQLEVGQTAQLTGRVADAGGSPIPGAVATWTSDTPTIASVTATGQVTALSPGTAHFTGSAGGFTGVVTITVLGTPQLGSGTVAGQIINAAFGEPLFGATISGGNGQTTQSDEGGGFTLPNIPGGSSIQIAAPGFVATTYFGVQITGATTTVGAIPLVPVSTLSGSFSGHIIDAVTSEPIPNVQLTVRSGVNATTGTPVLQVQSDASGAYTGALPAGTYTVTAAAPAYTTASGTVPSVGGLTIANQNIVLSPLGLSSSAYRFVLTWGGPPLAPPDLDAHLVGPATDSTAFEVAYYRPVVSNGSGVVAELDGDASEGFGPETITLSQSRAGLYRYYVAKECCEESFATSGARVSIFHGSALVATLNVPSSDGQVWAVFELNALTGAITPLNTISPDDEIPGAPPPPASAVRRPTSPGAMARTRASDLRTVIEGARAHPKPATGSRTPAPGRRRPTR